MLENRRSWLAGERQEACCLNKASKKVHRPGEKSSREMPGSSCTCEDLKVGVMANKLWKAGEKEAVMLLMYGISVAQLTSGVFSNYLCMQLYALNASYQKEKQSVKGLAKGTSVLALVEIKKGGSG